jgi:alcohol dehydrogenase
VLASCISACGVCRYCRQGGYGQCRNGGGWVLGHLVNGVQAEYARLPFADLSTYRLAPNMSNESAVLLADILPSSYEVGVLTGPAPAGDDELPITSWPLNNPLLIAGRSNDRG